MLFDRVIGFFEADGADAGAADPGQGDAGQGDGAAGSGADPGQGDQEKTLTQSEVNRLVAGAKKNATEKLLKDLGVETAEGAKDALAKFRERQEAEKTELERVQGETDKERKSREAAEARAEAAESRFTAISKGVPADRAERVVKLAGSYEGETPEERIDAVLAEFPELKGQPGAPANLGGPSGGQEKSEKERVQAQIAQGFGLKTGGA